MDNSKPQVTLALSWAGAALTWALQNWSPVLSSVVAIAAIVASIHSSLANRAKKKFYEHDWSPEQRERIIRNQKD